jgi:hypothetical protein
MLRQVLPAAQPLLVNKRFTCRSDAMFSMCIMFIDKHYKLALLMSVDLSYYLDIEYTGIIHSSSFDANDTKNIVCNIAQVFIYGMGNINTESTHASIFYKNNI